MADFKVIETQEELDQIMGERLGREREKFEAKYKDLLADNEKLTGEVASLRTELESGQGKVSQYEETISGLESKVKQYETTALKEKIALEHRLPRYLADRLQGEDEESIRKDAQALMDVIDQNQPVLPLKSSDPEPVFNLEQALDQAYKSMAGDLNLDD